MVGNIEASLREKRKCSLRNKIETIRELGSFTEDELELELVESELMGDIDDLIQEMRNFPYLSYFRETLPDLPPPRVRDDIPDIHADSHLLPPSGYR